MATRSRRSRKTPSPDMGNLTDYRYPDTRKNNPPAGLAAQGRIAEIPKQRYAYNPHLPTVLRFDATGKTDGLPELLETARQRPLTAEEAQIIADALKNHEPWLEWSGKRERRWFEVDAIALHIHERVSAQATLRVAARQNVQRGLWADPELEYQEAVQFYQHDVTWANRLILGDNLVVMNSLAKREGLAGKVQMIYIDPPYGIKFSSNFQPTIFNRDVKDREQDLTREPEMVKAYQDTWNLGLHSYLAYLRDRLHAAKDLLADSGSVFVQIGDENLHRVRGVMDEVFKPENFAGVIFFTKTGSLSSETLDSVGDFLLWYTKDKERMKYRKLYLEKVDSRSGLRNYSSVEKNDGSFHRLSQEQIELPDETILSLRLFGLHALDSQSGGEKGRFPIHFQGRTYRIAVGSWKSNEEGIGRLANAERLGATEKRIGYKRYLEDFKAIPLTNLWSDTRGEMNPNYVIQTSPKVIERCILMTTDPGDLVLDPTCGGGTTAYVAEQWGRRWITIDTSRVSIALARQRLLTAKYDYFKTGDGSNQLHAKSFVYKTVPHIMLKSIAQNVALDPIFAKWEPILKEKLEYLNLALGEVTPETRRKLQAKLAEKERKVGRRAVTEADRRRWLLPKDGWQEWEVPYDSDPDAPAELQDALKEYRTAWRAKMDGVNSCIAANADSEELVDQPEKVAGVVRVSGPFTVEAVQPIVELLEMDTPIAGAPETLDTFGNEPLSLDEPVNAEAYLDKMLRLLRKDGVRFPDGKVMVFGSLEPLSGNADWLHAEGEWSAQENSDAARRVAVSVGPQYGAVASLQVEECIWAASRRGYDDLVFAGFSFDGAAQAIIQTDPNPRVRIHMANIRPDVNMGDLLKETPDSQLFTVFGLPRTEVRPTDGGEHVVEMQGVDIFDPVNNVVQSTGADKVAAWFLDSDYDGQTFCISQAFFPDASAWQNLARSLKGVIDPEAFSAFSGTTSLPFSEGKHKRIAVKVIDPRGNEVMRVHSLDSEVRYGAH